MRPALLSVASALAALLTLSGCQTAAPAYAQQAQQQLDATAQQYRPSGQKPALPVLTAQSSANDYLRFALLNHPQVEAAYANWRATVSQIGPAHSLPDPKLTLEADIAQSLMTLMPGVMFDVMSSSKRAAQGRAAAASAEVAHRQFLATAQLVARRLREAWIELAYAHAAHELHGAAAASVEETIAFAHTGFATGRDAGALSAQYALQDELAEHHAHHAMLGDRLAAARIGFKAALGLLPDATDPPWPAFPLTVEPLPPDSALWQRILTRNPDLAIARALIDQSVAAVAVAEKAGTPDFTVGAMVDVKANPLMVRPAVSLTLPVWRQRLADQIASAQAQHQGAAAQLNAAQLDLAAQFARDLFAVHRADRLLAYVDHTALPNTARFITAADADYQTGRGAPTVISAAHTRQVLLQLERLELLRARADAVTELLYLTADAAPSSFASSRP